MLTFYSYSKIKLFNCSDVSENETPHRTLDLHYMKMLWKLCWTSSEHIIKGKKPSFRLQHIF